MPKITLELPDPVFVKGDVLKWNDLIFHVFAVSCKGAWEFYNGELSFDKEEIECRYHVAVQAGAALDGSPVRPGTILAIDGGSILDGRMGRKINLELWRK